MRGFFVGVVLARFRVAFAAIATVTVTGAAFTAFTALVRAGAAFCADAGILHFGRAGCRFGRGGLARHRVAGATLCALAATFAATLTPAFAGWTLGTGFRTVDGAVRLGFGPAFGFDFAALLIAALAATLAGRALLALTAFCTLATCGAGFAVATFDAAFTARVVAGVIAAFCAQLCSAFATATAFAAFTAASIAATPAAFAFAAFAARLAPLCVTAAFAGFLIFRGGGCCHGLGRGTAKQVFQPAKEAP